MRKIFYAVLFLLASFGGASAQSACPYIAYGAVLTAAQWQDCFEAKADAVGGPYLLLSGGAMNGPLTTTASTVAAAGFNLPAGAAPSSPNNGDLWTTATGIFTQINGSTYQLSTGGASIASATINDLAVYTGTNSIGGLATADNGVLVTNGSGVPSISATLPSGLVIPGYAQGPGSSTPGCLAPWANTIGTLLGNNCALSFSGNLVSEINQTAYSSLTPFTADGAQFTVQNCVTSANCTAYSIYNSVLATDYFYYDGTRSVIVNPANNGSSAVISTNAFGAYVLNNAATFSTGGILRGAADLYWGQAIANVAGAEIWGAAFGLNDSSNCNSSGSPCLLNGIELDYTSIGTHTNIQGVTLELSTQHSVTGNGFQISDSTTANGQWTIGFVTDDGAAGTAFRAGATAVSGSCGSGCSSQPFVFARYDSGGSLHADSLYDNSSGTLNWPGSIQAAAGIYGVTAFGVIGSSSGQVSITVQAAAGTYNFNLPITAGTAGYVLTSQGGGTPAMTWTNPASLAVAVGSITGLGVGVATALGNAPNASGGFTTFGTDLPLSGGTMAGNVAMGGYNISGGGTITGTGLVAYLASGTSTMTMKHDNGQEGTLFFNNGSTNDWQLGENTSNHFFAYDNQGPGYIWQMTSGGTFAITPPVSIAGTLTVSGMTTDSGAGGTFVCIKSGLLYIATAGVCT